jgi:hypothetical protein
LLLESYTWFGTSFVAIIKYSPFEGRKKMLNLFILADFLYFPKDKSEYIPAVISFTIFFIGAILAMRYFIVVSKKEAEKAKELEEKILHQPTQKEQ